MIFFHGSAAQVTEIDPNVMSDDGELLCASASVNVALRYGQSISKFELVDNDVLQVTLLDWMSGAVPSVEKLRESGVAAVIVAGSDCFDFPVDTLFVLHPRSVRYLGEAGDAELNDLDDGLAKSHTPRPSETGWRQYVADTFEGVEDCLDGWQKTSDGGFSYELAESGIGMPWKVEVTRGSSGWLVSSTSAGGPQDLGSIEDALVAADKLLVQKEGQIRSKLAVIGIARKIRP